MSNADKTILVLGATGQQGGSTARALVADGWSVRALVRDVQSQKTQALAALRVEIVAGDLDDPASLKAAAKGAYGVFLAQPSSGQPEYGMSDEDEVRRGVSVADAAREAGVEHFVYSSIPGAAPDLGVGHFESKWRVEEHVRGLPLDWTVVRPTAFMEILLLPHFGLARNELTFFMRPEKTMQFIAVEDIGKLAAKVFAHRGAFAGKTLDIAGETLTGTAIAEKISAATGRSVSYQRFPQATLDASPLLARLVELSEGGPVIGQADIDALRKLSPGLLSFDEWLEKTGKALIAQL